MTSTSPQPEPSALDVARGIEMLGSPEALRMVLHTALASLSEDVPNIGRELAAGDVQAGRRRLHAIKGYLPIFGSDALVNDFLALEKLGKTAPADTLSAGFTVLRPQLERLLAEMAAFLASPAA